MIEAELYNLRVIRNIPSAYEIEGYEAYLSASNMLGDMDPAKLSDGQKGTLDKIVTLHKDLVQVKSYADVVWPIWGKSMPCKGNPDELVFTSKSYDNADMKPYIVPYLLDDQNNVKGNLIIVAGGGYSSRNNKGEGFPIAAAFNEKGYNCFLLQRRVDPYCAEDIWMDMQRSIRYIRFYGEKLGFGAMNNLLAAGFSGGSATVLGAIEYLYGDIQPTIYDPTYVPDEIDAVNSDLDIAFLLYGPNPAPVHEGVYEGLVTENEKIPELFIAAGADDPTGAPEDNWVLYQTAREKTNAELHTFANVGHGFGVGFKKTNSSFWIDMADNFVTQSLAAREKAAKKNK